MLFRLEIVIGPMYSGKTTELIRRISRYTSIETPTLCVNHSLDSRTKNYIRSHNELKIPAIKTSKLLDIAKTTEYKEARVIGIDESQFFEDLVEFVKYTEDYCYTLKTAKTVIVSGLDGDSNRKPFGQVLELIPLCDTVEKLTALDKTDGKEAPFTKRLTKDSEQILIGATESYMAVSRANYLI